MSFLLSNARFWFDRYHVDGLRVDAVSSMLYLDYSRPEGEWIPNARGGRENLEAIDFLRRMNGAIQERFPGVLIVAEESTSWPGVSRPASEGGLGFGCKWNMGWMNDVLRYMSRDPAHRRFHQSDLTFGMLYAFAENFVLPLSHDEVVHGKGSLLGRMPGSDPERFANLRLLLAFMYGHPGKKLLFMGGEFGQWSEWDCDRELDWRLLEHAPHRGIQRLAADLNSLYRESPCLHRLDADPEGFEWIDCEDADSSILSFRRRSDDPADGELVFACNFSHVTRAEYRVGLPWPGRYQELLNTDAEAYGGSGRREWRRGGGDPASLARPGLLRPGYPAAAGSGRIAASTGPVTRGVCQPGGDANPYIVGHAGAAVAGKTGAPTRKDDLLDMPDMTWIFPGARPWSRPAGRRCR